MKRSEAAGVVPVELASYGRPISSVFDLLGRRETDLTAALGWVLARSRRLRDRFLDRCALPIGGDIEAVRLETADVDGRTDIELVREGRWLSLRRSEGGSYRRSDSWRPTQSAWSPPVGACSSRSRTPRRRGQLTLYQESSMAYPFSTCPGPWCSTTSTPRPQMSEAPNVAGWVSCGHTCERRSMCTIQRPDGRIASWSPTPRPTGVVTDVPRVRHRGRHVLPSVRLGQGLACRAAELHGVPASRQCDPGQPGRGRGGRADNGRPLAWYRTDW